MKLYDEFRTNKLISASVAGILGLFLLFLFLGIVGGLVGFNVDGYWTNYWTFFAGILPIIAVVLVFYAQLVVDKNTYNVQNYISLQNELQQEISDRLVHFTEYSIVDKKVLISDLAFFLYSLQNIDIKRLQLDFDKDQNSENVTDFSEFSQRVHEIINSEKYSEIVQAVRQNFYDLGPIIDKKISDENKLTDDILGYWIVNEYRAKNAKYIIGVSTLDKRVLGIFKISDKNKISKDENNGRVYFGGTDAIMFQPKKDSSNSVYIPFLKEKWTAQNPVLYYKRFLKNNDLLNDN